jgi:hypothetical protein
MGISPLSATRLQQSSSLVLPVTLMPYLIQEINPAARLVLMSRPKLLHVRDGSSLIRAISDMCLTVRLHSDDSGFGNTGHENNV